MAVSGPGGRVRIAGGAQLHFTWIDHERCIYHCIEMMGMPARGLASALQGIQGDAQGLSSGKGGPGRSTSCWGPAARKGSQGQYRSHVEIFSLPEIQGIIF